MTEFGKVLTATGLSVLAHVSLFTVLALTPGRSIVPMVEEQPEKPLEVTIETVTPQQEQEIVPALPALLRPVKRNAIQTQLDPEHLKKVDKAPENPTEIAAYNSQATLPKPVTAPSQSVTDAAPVSAVPTPIPASDDETLALEPKATPEPTTKPKPVDEVGIDALGKYEKAVGNAIGSRWEFYRKTQKDTLAVGVVRIKFALNAQGEVSEVRVLSNTAAPANAAMAIRAVKEAKIPPIPAEWLSQVTGGRIEPVYTFYSF